MDKTLNEFELITSICWKEIYQLITIDKTKGTYTDQYRLGLISIFVPNSNPFKLTN